MGLPHRHYRAIITSDWHADAVTLGVERYSEIHGAASTIFQHCIDVDRGEEETVFIFAGDLTNPDNPRCWRAARLAARIAYGLASRNIPSIWITGNHDVMEDGNGSHSLMGLDNGCSFIHVIDSPMLVEPLPGLRILALPYCARSRAYDPVLTVRDFAQAPQPPAMCVSHLMLEGIAPGSEAKEFARGRDIFLPINEIQRAWPSIQMFNGHYHLGMVYRDVHIPGSLARLSRAEACNTPRFLEIEL